MPFSSDHLKVGVARVDITPEKFPVLVNGNFFESRASQVTDPLSVRSLVLSHGGTKIALAVVDTCMLPVELTDQAKKIVFETIKLPLSRIMISATHCHSAPSVREIFATGIDQEYAAALPQRIAQAIIQADAEAQFASIGYGADADPENVFCRRFLMNHGTAWTENPAFTGSNGDFAQMNPGGKQKDIVCPTGKADPTVSVLGILDNDNSPLAILGNYSTHYVGASQISADYFAVFADRIAKLLNANDRFLGIMTNGTSGDANSIDFYNPGRTFDRFTVGQSVAQAAHRAFEKIEFASDVSIDMLENSLELQVRKPTEEQIDLAKKCMDQVKDRPLKTREEVYARETLFLADYPDAVQVKLQAIRIGQLGIVAIPCEVYNSTGHEIRQASPMEQTFVISHANGAFGYIPPEEQFFFGGYTTWRARTSLLEKGAERKIRLLALNMLEHLDRVANG